MGKDLTRIPLQNYESVYHITECGKIIRVAKKNKSGVLVKLKKESLLKPYLINNRAIVTLRDNGISETMTLNRLVYSHFKGKVKRNESIVSIDGNPLNCHVDNLRKKEIKNALKK